MNPNVTWRVAMFLLLSFLSASPQSTNLRLRLASPGVNGGFRLASDGYDDPGSGSTNIYKVEASVDLSHWVEIATLHRIPRAVQMIEANTLASVEIATLQGTNLLYTDPASSSLDRRFYRLRAVPPETLDWKNQITMPADAFSSPVQFISWVKFVISTNEPTRVYFADSSAYNLHYHFVTNRIPGFANLSRAEIDLRSQYQINRQLYLGTIIQPWNQFPNWPALEYSIQLVGRDPIPPAKVRELFDTVRSAVLSRAGALVSYLPTFEQSASAEINRAFFETNGIPLRRADDWIRTETCYAQGWALGRLVFVSATNISDAYANGTLRPTDILLTDGVPAELPYVAGIITFVAATPNSHVAILAQSYNVPFVFVADPNMRERILSYTNREVALQVTSGFASPGSWNTCRMLLIALDANFNPALKAELLALKQPPQLNIRRKERFGAYTSFTTNLRPEDARFFGGKAANFGLLRRVLPTNSPTPSLAVSMDLWDDFMDQVMSSGLTLRADISNRLSQFTYPPNVAAVKAELNTIRSLIRNQTQFTANQEQTILTALSPFATNRNIRFRSSSNVEDADYFSGAGLYDSFSGCSGDDLDGDTSGPSICDPTEDGERGVFRAIRRVYASFYNDNAFLERLRLKINETEVGMGLLVHYSAPDDIEMANGVATVKLDSGGGYDSANLVSQRGAVSITNPDGNSIPEEVWATYTDRMGLSIGLAKLSNLLPLGENVMTWPTDYEDLAHMLLRVAHAYEPSKPGLALDFEYKKIKPGILDVKQVRQVPSPANTGLSAPYLLNERRIFVTLQSTLAFDPFAAHRLKSRWSIETRNLQMTAANLRDGLFTNVTLEWISGDRVVTNTLTGLSNLTYRLEGELSGVPVLIYSWQMNSAVGPADCALEIPLLFPAATAQLNPIIALDFGLELTANYDHPVWLGLYPPFTFDHATLTPLQTNSPYEVLTILNYDQGGSGPTNVTITSRYYIGSNGAYAGDPPLFRFEETRIEGLTSRPIVLHGFFSQTWRGNHRQDSEYFLFEPHLEEGIDPALLQELEAKDIRMIYVRKNQTAPNRMFTFRTHDGGPLPD